MSNAALYYGDINYQANKVDFYSQMNEAIYYCLDMFASSQFIALYHYYQRKEEVGEVMSDEFYRGV